jgi:nitrous oxidase accessory protein NosD
MVTWGLVLAALSAITVSLDCGSSIEDAVAAAAPGTVIRLATGCVYPGPVTLRPAAPVVLEGTPGARIAGGLVVEGTGALALRALTIDADAVALTHVGAGALTLDRVTLRGGTALHVEADARVRIRDSRLRGVDTGLWVQGARAFHLRDSVVEGGEVAVVVRGVREAVHIGNSRLRAEGTGQASAAVFVHGPAPADLVGNRIEHVSRTARPAPFVVRAGAGVVLDGNLLVGDRVGVAFDEGGTLGCNRYEGVLMRTDGAHTRACGRDLAPDSLDWRRRVGAGPSVAAKDAR